MQWNKNFQVQNIITEEKILNTVVKVKKETKIYFILSKDLRNYNSETCYEQLQKIILEE